MNASDSTKKVGAEDFRSAIPQSNLARKTASRTGNISFEEGIYHFSYILERNNSHVLELGIAQDLLNMGSSSESM